MKSRAAVRKTTAGSDALKQGREAFQRKAWGAAYSGLVAADHESPLPPDALAELAQAALLMGKDVEGADYLARAHQGFLSVQAIEPAVRCAFWLGFTSFLNGEFAKGSGWLARANRLLENHTECVEHGYLRMPDAYRAFREGDPVAAQAIFRQASEIGERFGDHDLVTLALQGQGRALIRQGEIAHGLALLDEAMVSVTAGEVSALNAGGVYCSVLDACSEVYDLQRAREWTSALERWCASQPDVVPYRGQCLVHRAELLQFLGAWPDALRVAQQATECLAQPVPKPSVGAAFYQIAEVHRLRGDFAVAEKAYQQASRWQPMTGPGHALLRLAQGQVDAAKAAILRLVEEVHQPAARAKALDALVEIVLAAGEVEAARSASHDLKAIAANCNLPFLRALSHRASGALLLADGDPKAALAELRESLSLWCELQAPYQASLVRMQIALACRELGEEENALAELSLARETLQQLGAAVELSRVNSLLSGGKPAAKTPLTDRELQVLKLVAAGHSNRAVAQALTISEKTVARHLSNIFTKLNLYSRTAAAAYAYDHNLV
jgi:DNA-binding NarL/FixJ family response regulator